jgi:hypothetical protein
MRAMIRGKDKNLAGNDRREATPAHAKPGKALRQSVLMPERENKRTTRKSAAGYRESIAHWQKS